jgi:Cu(I)-responsive transcriptional regulator
MEGQNMNIGQVAEASGVSAKMIRHYEEIGVIPKISRTLSGYRQYSETDVHLLRFVRQARDLGFSMEQIKTLVGLWRNKRRKSSDVKRLAQEHVSELETKILKLQAMVKTLRHLSHQCHGDERPDCPILGELENENERP